jgi:hypothetical protein
MLSAPGWGRMRLMGEPDWGNLERIQWKHQQRTGDDSEQQLLAVALLKDAAYHFHKGGDPDRPYMDELRRALAAIASQESPDFCAQVEEALKDPSFFASVWGERGVRYKMKELGQVFVSASLWLAMELWVRGSGMPLVTGVVRRADELHRRLVESAWQTEEVERPELHGIIGFIENEPSQPFQGLLELTDLQAVISERDGHDSGR